MTQYLKISKPFHDKTDAWAGQRYWRAFSACYCRMLREIFNCLLFLCVEFCTLKSDLRINISKLQLPFMSKLLHGPGNGRRVPFKLVMIQCYVQYSIICCSYVLNSVLPKMTQESIFRNFNFLSSQNCCMGRATVDSCRLS